MIDEVLVSAKTSAGVAGQRVWRLLFRANRARNRQVAGGERNAYRCTHADRQIEEAQDEARGQHHDDAGAAAAPGATPPRTGAAPLVAHVHPLPQVSLTGLVSRSRQAAAS